jgi:hypothetical protein
MADFDVHYDPITIDVNPSTVTLAGLDNINSTITLSTPEPLKTESRTELAFPQPLKTELAIPDPIKTESKAELDVKPLVFDQCLNISLDPLPPTCIRQPYQQHFGVTVFGVEVFGFEVTGELRHIIDEKPKRPQVVWGGEAETGRALPQPQSKRGLRIRLGE